MTPKISIITITYNSEKTLEETVLSVTNQNYPNLEYLIIDGGSTDHTLEIVDKYREKISFVLSEPDSGISDAFNKGITHATGDIIGIINSDDLLCDGALQIVADNYDSDVDVYRGYTKRWNVVTGHYIRGKVSMKFPLYINYFKKSGVSHPSTFIARKAYKTWGCYRTKFKYRMDVDLLTRFYRNGAVFKFINSELAIFREGGTTDCSPKNKTKEIEWIILDNGGNYIMAKLMVLQFLIAQYTKRFLKNLRYKL